MQFDSSQHRSQQDGFTLIEVMITVAIIGVLAAIALPNYTDYITRANLIDAMSTLAGHRVKMEQYYQDNRTYLNACAAGTIATTPSATANFTYQCTNLTAQTYTIQATGQGNVLGFVYTIDQSNNRSTTVTGLDNSVGYASSPTCWVRKKPDQC